MYKTDSDIRLVLTLGFSNGKRLKYCYQRANPTDEAASTYKISVEEINDHGKEECIKEILEYSPSFEGDPDVEFYYWQGFPINFKCDDSCFDALYHIKTTDEFVTFLKGMVLFSGINPKKQPSSLKSFAKASLTYYDNTVFTPFSQDVDIDTLCKDVKEGDRVDFVVDSDAETVNIVRSDAVLADLPDRVARVLMPLLESGSITVDASIASIGKYVDQKDRKPLLEIVCFYKVNEDQKTGRIYTLGDLFDDFWDRGFYVRDAQAVFYDLLSESNTPEAQFHSIQEKLEAIVQANMTTMDDIDEISVSVEEKNICQDYSWNYPWNYSADFLFHYLFKSAAWGITNRVILPGLTEKEAIIATLRSIDEFTDVDADSLENIADIYLNDAIQSAEGYREVQHWKKGEEWNIHIELI